MLHVPSTGTRELEAPKYNCEALMTGVGTESGAPSGVQRQSPSSGEAETVLAFGRSVKATNLPTFQKFETQKKSDTICVFFARSEV